MQAKEVIGQICEKIEGEHAARLKTFVEMTCSLILGQRVCLTNLASRLDGRFKHQAKKVWRFFRNEKVNCLAIRQALILHLLRGKTSVVVVLDWTEWGCWASLVAGIRVFGRTVPVFTVTVRKQADGGYPRSRTERAVMMTLKELLPDRITERIVIMDRGFSGAAWLAWLREQSWDFVVRLKDGCWVRGENYDGKICEYPGLAKGMQWREVGWVKYAERELVQGRLILSWSRKQKEPWCLLTSILFERLKGAEVKQLYGQRWFIESSFKEQKNRKYGFNLDEIKLKDAARVDRLWLVIAFAYYALLCVGRHIRQLKNSIQYEWSTAKDAESSFFALAVRWFRKNDFLPPGLILDSTAEVLP